MEIEGEDKRSSSEVGIGRVDTCMKMVQTVSVPICSAEDSCSSSCPDGMLYKHLIIQHVYM